MCVLTVKYEISSIILTTFRNGEEGKLYHYPLSTSKRTRKKPTQIRVKEQPITAYSRNKILRDLTGDITIENNKVIRKQKLMLTSGYCKPCFSRTNNLCNQVVPATTFKRNTTSKTYQIFYQKNCKGSYIIYLLEYVRVSSKMSVKYIGTSETDFTLSLITTEKMAPGRTVYQHQIISTLRDIIYTYRRI